MNYNRTDGFCLLERPANEVYDNGPALFDMLDILVGTTDDTERQIIYRPPKWHLFSFVGTPPLPTNLCNSPGDLSIFRHPVESAL